MMENKHIQEVEHKLISVLKKKFPDAFYTIFITKWNDNTFQVELRHAISINENMCLCHSWTWYNENISYTNYEVPKIIK